MTDPTRKVIAVFGASRREENNPLYQEAYQVGRLLAGAGYTVLNGGYNGSMAAVSRGAAEAGGHVIGVTCAVFDPLPANAWLSEEIKAPSMLARLQILMDRADGYVALRGGIGTLTEVTLAWSLLQTRTYAGKPLVLVGPQWQELVAAFCVHADMGASIAALARVVDTPGQLLDALAAPLPPVPPSPPPLG